MAVDVLALCARRLPAVYRAALSALEQASSAGDEAARRVLEEAREASVVTALDIEGEAGEGGGRLYLSADGGSLSALEQPPRGRSVLYAVSLPAAVVRLAIAERAQPVPGDAAALRWLAALASRRARELFGATAYAFDLHLRNAPQVGALRLRVALGRGEHPPTPEFSLGLAYEDLAQARDAGMAPHQLLVSGKITMEGDAAKAMMLGMTLAQLR